MPADRRAEAHLWLLLEDVLRSVRRGHVEAWEGRRVFGATIDALAEVGVLPRAVGEALVAEFDDVLAVRGQLPVLVLTAARWNVDQPAARAGDASVAPDAGAVWLEADIERHLGLLAGFPSAQRPRAAAELLRIVGGPARAFDAVGLRGGLDLLDELDASLREAGLTEPTSEATAPARPEWTAYLASTTSPSEVVAASPADVAVVRTDLGALGGWTVTVREVRRRPGGVEVEVGLRPLGESPGTDAALWHIRGRDPEGHLHLGGPVVRGHRRTLLFELTPTLGDDVRSLDLRVTHRGSRVEGRVSW